MKSIIIRHIINTALLICLAANTHVSGQGIEFVSSTLHHNPYRSVGKVGEYVYCGGIYGLHIFDISNPSTPDLIQICDFTDIHQMFVDGNYAYLLGSGYNDRPGFRVLDTSDPLNPIIVGSIFHDFGYRFNRYYNNTVYSSYDTFDSLGRACSRIEIIDASIPSDPVLSDTIYLQYLTSDMWAADGYLHVTTTEFDFWENNWSIYSLSDPARPDHISTMNFGTDLIGQIATCENYAYLNQYSGVNIYDFSDPYSPYLVRSDNSGVFDNIMTIEENIAYARESSYRILALDLSDPVYPEQMGTVYLQNGYGDFYYAGDTCFTAIKGSYSDYVSQFTIVDFTDLYDPVVLGEHWTPGITYDVQLSGDYAYVANASSGLTVVDISAPEEPVVLDSFEPDGVIDILIRGNRAYILAGISYFGIFDITTQDQPVLLGYYSDVLGRVGNVFVDGDYAYVTKVPHNDPHSSFISILDISDPTAPAPAYSIENLYFPLYVVVDDDYAYISCREDLNIYNISNLNSITFVSSYVYRNNVRQIAVEPPFVYMASLSNAIEIINVSDPTNPYFVTEYDSLSAFDITLTDDSALLKGINGIYLMDISNPEDPILISSYPNRYGWSCQEATIRGEYIYDPAYQRLQILKFTETGIEEVGVVDLPERFALLQNYPNPFNPSTTIRYSLPAQSNVRIEIYNILGQKITTLFDGHKQAGYHTVTWQADHYPSGIYFTRLEAGHRSESIKIVLLK